MITTPTSLTEAQTELLDLFALSLPDESLVELKQLLLQFKFDLLDKLADAEWNEKGMSDPDISERLSGHKRTSYVAQTRFLQQNPLKS